METAKGFNAYDNGLGFANTFRLLLTRTSHEALMKHGTYTDGTLMMPTVVNGALACELFLKALIDDPPRDHSIIKLLDKAEDYNPGIKQCLEYNCIDCMHKKKGDPEYNHQNYMQDLARIDTAFYKLRYWHEPKPNASIVDPVVCNLGFLDVFIALLQALCQVRHGPRPLQS